MDVDKSKVRVLGWMEVLRGNTEWMRARLTMVRSLNARNFS